MTTTAAEQPDDDPGTALEALVGKALAEINKGTVTLADILKALSPQQESAQVPATLPTPASITTEERAAMDLVPKVFGQVVPTERRALQPTEVSLLVTEKQTLDKVKGMAEARLADITVTVHNHLDVEIETALPEGERPIRDDKGHYIAQGKVAGPDVTQQFSREVRNYAATLSVADLQALETAGELEHEDFLALTKQTRVIDEMKVVEALKRKPSLITAIAKATKPGRSGTSMFLRKK